MYLYGLLEGCMRKFNAGRAGRITARGEGGEERET